MAYILEQFGTISPGSTAHYCRHILRGLQYLHINDVVHLDVKPGNVLVGDHGRCKLVCQPFPQGHQISHVTQRIWYDCVEWLYFNPKFSYFGPTGSNFDNSKAFDAHHNYKVKSQQPAT